MTAFSRCATRARRCPAAARGRAISSWARRSACASRARAARNAASRTAPTHRGDASFRGTMHRCQSLIATADLAAGAARSSQSLARSASRARARRSSTAPRRAAAADAHRDRRRLAGARPVPHRDPEPARQQRARRAGRRRAAQRLGAGLAVQRARPALVHRQPRARGPRHHQAAVVERRRAGRGQGPAHRLGGSIAVDMRFFEIARGESPMLEQARTAAAQAELRGFMHDFANEILRVLTGKAGSFGTRLTFARKVGPGRKDVYVVRLRRRQPGPRQQRQRHRDAADVRRAQGHLVLGADAPAACT